MSKFRRENILQNLGEWNVVATSVGRSVVAAASLSRRLAQRPFKPHLLAPLYVDPTRANIAPPRLLKSMLDPPTQVQHLYHLAPIASPSR
ncbi:hypothetical protein TIFTF001_024929 [Ficus carica]|uniref:Uncharacterized protein n=1 Tax=Ficus carica TaxID=3494 RepID=A0AA88AQJ1_FICCA|nr:hypothetical protein TIFTF001_024929 [Ficus carica]